MFRSLPEGSTISPPVPSPPVLCCSCDDMNPRTLADTTTVNVNKICPRTGAPLVYELDDDLKVIPQKDAIAPLQGRYLGNQENIKARISGVANQTKIVFVEGG